MLIVPFLLLLGSAARPQIVLEMTPEKIREAILWGPTQDSFGAYVSKGYANCDFTTPYLRVAIAAKEAKKAYKPFAETDVTPEMTEPVVVMVCHPNPVNGNMLTDGVADVENVVILPKVKGGTPIQPKTSAKVPEPLRNGMGNTFDAVGLTVTFPLEILAPDNQVHVVYSKKIYPGGFGGGGCDDCAMDFKLGKVR